MRRRNSGRLLMGPGPSPVHPSVLAALGEPTLGHLDPEFLTIMGETMDMLRQVFGSDYKLTMPISGTGSAGMEASLVNLLEPGDHAVVTVIGTFGERMAEIAARCGAHVRRVDAEWGTPVDPAAVARAIDAGPAPKLVTVVHAETSTGVRQPLAEIAALADAAGALMVVDTVTSLGGMPIPIRQLGLDFVYSGTQKCLSCPPGLSPVTVSDRAMDVIQARRTPVHSWYLDLGLVQRYWGQERFYHHTAPVNMIFALHEALAVLLAEGLDAVWQRHAANAAALQVGLDALGLHPLVAPEYRLPSLVVVKVPADVDEAAVRRHLLEQSNIEIGAGLGPLKGKIWRIGVMGHGSNRHNVTAVTSALALALDAQGHRADVAAAMAAMDTAYLASVTG